MTSKEAKKAIEEIARVSGADLSKEEIAEMEPFFKKVDAVQYEQYDSGPDTMRHIQEVRKNISEFQREMSRRANNHDNSKLEGIEKEVFDRVTPLLRQLDYDSLQYQISKKMMGKALESHYAKNSHHPEHYKNGVKGMDLFDLVEMFLDWKAAVKRHESGDFEKSIIKNARRFKIPVVLRNIMLNTAKKMTE